MEPLKIEKLINFNNYKIKVTGEGLYNSEDPEQEIEKKEIRRFSLKLKIENPKGNKPLIAIMMNPSKTFPKKDKNESKIDPTVQNIIKIAYKCGYNEIYVKNIFSLINPNSSILYEKDKVNTNKIKECLTKYNYDTLIAWGTKIKNNHIEDILEYLKNRKLFVWKLTKKNKPKHPSPRNTDINKFLQQPNPKLISIKFDDNGNISTC